MKRKIIFTALIIQLISLFAFPVIPVQAQKASELRLKKIVIDPGHGGKDAGAVSRDKKTYEKTLTLKIALSLKQKIEAAYPDVEVILTRSKDVYLTLNERAEIANKNDADLFVSIHINAVSTANADGFSTHILGQSSNKDRDLFSQNLEVCKRENSVILLEEDYTTKYQGFDPNDPESFIFFTLMQNAFYEQSLLFAEKCDICMSKGPIKRSRGISQDPFYVLWKTTMPSVLIEAGFISNPSDLSVLRSESGINGISEALFKAFSEFKDMYDTSLKSGDDDDDVRTVAVEQKESRPAERETTVQKQVEKKDTQASVLYGTQVLVSSRNISENDALFKGYDCMKLQSGKLYKYIIGISADQQHAKNMYRNIKKYFPDAFTVRISQDRTVTRL